MRTRWGESGESGETWAAYPRPQLRRDEWQSLNGPWRYAIRSATASHPGDWQGEIQVPFCVESELSGVGESVLPDQRLWYERDFDIPPTWDGMAVWLYFGAVDYECVVWVNDAWVGSHKGGSDSFSFEITDFVSPGPNRVRMQVADPSNHGEQPRGKQHLNHQGNWYTPVTGIWQTVWLEPVPVDNSIAEVRLCPDVDEHSLFTEILLRRPTTRRNVAAQLSLFRDDTEVCSVQLPPDRRCAVPVPDPHLWHPDDPFLYRVEVRLVQVEPPEEPRMVSGGDSEANWYQHAKPGGVLDRVESYTAFRKVSVAMPPGRDQPVIHVNDQPVFMLGPLDQGWWPDGLLTPPSEDALVWELTYLKAAGFNCLRKHIKVESSAYYYHCDRLGLMVWQDMPSGFAPAQHVWPIDEATRVHKAETMVQFEAELRRMVLQCQHHPSIVAWVIHNEGWGQYDTPRLCEWVRALDPTRLVNAISGWLDQDAGDVYDWHDYAEAPALPSPDPARALVLGEFGGIGWPVDGHLWDRDRRNRGYQTYHEVEEVRTAYERKMQAVITMVRERLVSAAIYTQTSDVEGEVNGLLTYDRMVDKLGAAFLKSQHELIYAAFKGAMES